MTERSGKELFQKMNAKVKVRHLYAQTRENGLRQSTLNYPRGRSFEDLARKFSLIHICGRTADRWDISPFR